MLSRGSDKSPLRRLNASISSVEETVFSEKGMPRPAQQVAAGVAGRTIFAGVERHGVAVDDLAQRQRQLGRWRSPPSWPWRCPRVLPRRCWPAVDQNTSPDRPGPRCGRPPEPLPEPMASPPAHKAARTTQADFWVIDGAVKSEFMTRIPREENEIKAPRVTDQAMPWWRSSASTAGSRPRNALKDAMAGRLPPASRIASR